MTLESRPPRKSKPHPPGYNSKAQKQARAQRAAQRVAKAELRAMLALDRLGRPQARIQAKLGRAAERQRVKLAKVKAEADRIALKELNAADKAARVARRAEIRKLQAQHPSVWLAECERVYAEELAMWKRRPANVVSPVGFDSPAEYQAAARRARDTVRALRRPLTAAYNALTRAKQRLADFEEDQAFIRMRISLGLPVEELSI